MHNGKNQLIPIRNQAEHVTTVLVAKLHPSVLIVEKQKPPTILDMDIAGMKLNALELYVRVAQSTILVEIAPQLKPEHMLLSITSVEDATGNTRYQAHG